LGFADNLAHDLGCGLSLVNKGNALPGIERQRIYIALSISGGAQPVDTARSVRVILT